MQDIPYPRLDEDMPLRIEEARAVHVREHLDPSDLLAVTQHLMLEIAEDTKHPLWPLVVHCTTLGTQTETGKLPHLCEGVGAFSSP